MLEREQRVYKALNALGVFYEQYQHEAVNTIEAAEVVDRQIGMHICKNLFLYNKNKAGEKEYYLLVMQGHKRFRSGSVSKELGVPRLSFGDPDHMQAYLDILPGSVSPLGLMNDKENHVRMLIDRHLLQEEQLAVHPCVNTATVVLSVKDMLEILLPAWHHTYTSVIVNE